MHLDSPLERMTKGRRRKGNRQRWLFLAIALAGAPSAAFSQAGFICDSTACPPQTRDEFSLNPYKFFAYKRESDILKCAPCVRDDGRFTTIQKRDAMLALAVTHLAWRNIPVARAACLDVLQQMDPCVTIDPALPAPVKKLFYTTQDSLLRSLDLRCKREFKTLAVGDIENNSMVGAMNLDTDRLCRGLQKVLMDDLTNATCLRLVDRDRFNVVQQERNLAGEDVAKLLGADNYMFGSLLQLGKKEFVLTLRITHITSEVIVSAKLKQKLDSGDDFLELEQKLLLEHIVPKIQELCEATDTGEMRKRIERWFAEGPGKVPDYKNYVLKVGEAMLADESKDTARARAAWTQVSLMNPYDVDAKQRASMLDAFAGVEARPAGKPGGN